jgi:hypothetical protein
MENFKEFCKKIELAGIPKQSKYRIYIPVGERQSQKHEFVIAGHNITVHQIFHDYGSKHGKGTNKHRWRYQYCVDDQDFWNFRSLAAYLYQNQKSIG